MTLRVLPADFVPRRGRPSADPPHQEPENLRKAGWVPTRFEVTEDVPPHREAYLSTGLSVGHLLEAARFSPAEVEEVRGKIDRWLRPPRTSVEIAGALHERVDQIEELLREQNDPPLLFRRQGTLVGFDLDENDQPVFRKLNVAGLQTALSRMADWLRFDKREKKQVMVEPPQKAASVVLQNPPKSVPVAIGITTAPTLRPDGSLLDVEGYDPATRLVYRRPPGLSPTRYRSDGEAVAIIDAMLRDFPWAGSTPEEAAANRANFYAWLLSPALRPYVGDFPTPVALFEAPTPRTGKDLLAGTVPLIYAGAPADPRTLASEDEVRKEIVSALLVGRTLLIYTNVSGTLSSDALAGLVTSTRWSGRRLGESLDVTFAVQMSVALTANNLSLGRDWPNRVYRIRLDARTPHPENRPFAVRDLHARVLERRNDLLGAVYRLCESWIADGAPEADVSWSSYSRWASVVGGVLRHAGIEGFLGNVEEETDDPDEESWQALYAWWVEKFGDRWVTATEAAGAAPVLATFWPEALLGPNGEVPANLAQRLGKHLQLRRDTVSADGLRLERLPRSRPARWRLVRVGG